MIKLKETIIGIPRFVYHVTRKSNLSNILKKGIIPNQPTDWEDQEKGVYLFRDKNSAEDAVMNWLGDRYEENEKLVLLTINTNGIYIKPSEDLETLDGEEGWELISYDTISPRNIVKVEDII